MTKNKIRKMVGNNCINVNLHALYPITKEEMKNKSIIDGKLYTSIYMLKSTIINDLYHLVNLCSQEIISSFDIKDTAKIKIDTKTTQFINDIIQEMLEYAKKQSKTSGPDIEDVGCEIPVFTEITLWRMYILLNEINKYVYGKVLFDLAEEMSNSQEENNLDFIKNICNIDIKYWKRALWVFFNEINDQAPIITIERTNLNKFGFLRETKELAIKAGIDTATGLHRTGLEEYLQIIFPNINDWVHDKTIPVELTNGKKCLKRPDYRSETLKMIVEFDGTPHYMNPDVIIKDKETTTYYTSLGYKVVRIPYFIQLTNEVVEILFGVKVKEPLFPTGIASLSSIGRNTPAYLCIMGIERMKEDFKKFPEQYITNKKYLESENKIELTRVDLI